MNHFNVSVLCDDKTDIQCFKNGTKALEGQTDQQLIELTQQDVKTIEVMVNKRVNTAVESGLPCYKKAYDAYLKGLEDIILNGEQERLNRAKTPEERSDAVKALAGLTQGIVCDEYWWAENINKVINSANCTGFETAGALNLLNFQPKLALIKSGLFLGEVALKTKNSVMSGVVGEVSHKIIEEIV